MNQGLLKKVDKAHSIFSKIKILYYNHNKSLIVFNKIWINKKKI
jgi:hypothetical protein